MQNMSTPDSPKQKTVEVVREFSDEGIKVQMKCEDVVSHQFFKRQWEVPEQNRSFAFQMETSTFK